MVKSVARAAIRTATGHSADQQITNAELNVWIDLEHKLFRRELQDAFPSAYATTDATQTLSTTDSLTLPADFEALVRLERQCGSVWDPVDVSDELTPHWGDRTFREEGTALKVDPLAVAAGTYRIIYIAKTADITSTDSPDETLLVPAGCEDIIIERVAARVRRNQEEDPTSHTAQADAVWMKQRRVLKKRYGKHPVPGLRRVVGY